MKHYLIALASVAGLCTALPACAQFQKPEDAIKYRQAALSMIGTHFSRIAGMAQGRIPFDAKVAAENADILNTLAKLPFTAFGEGTDKGAPTKAKAEVWKEAPKFKEAGDKMVAAVAKLDSATKTGDLDQIKAAVGAVGQSCKACHDNYREKSN